MALQLIARPTAVASPAPHPARTGGSELPSTSEFILHSLPDSAVGAFAENSLLPWPPARPDSPEPARPSPCR
ncbi:hypothetical protein ACFY8C_29995 [Streptomyces flavochromogenes]|uniref:Uncharacterized protein n=1 Tax=Streptomyces flavochromogenes TaxID=68199 RepID=A0ABW6XYV1_9ACTN|nr:hypothetical protein [Streptomyces flavochromogenes]